MRITTKLALLHVTIFFKLRCWPLFVDRFSHRLIQGIDPWSIIVIGQSLCSSKIILAFFLHYCYEWMKVVLPYSILNAAYDWLHFKLTWLHHCTFFLMAQGFKICVTKGVTLRGLDQYVTLDYLSFIQHKKPWNSMKCRVSVFWTGFIPKLASELPSESSQRHSRNEPATNL